MYIPVGIHFAPRPVMRVFRPEAWNLPCATQALLTILKCFLALLARLRDTPGKTSAYSSLPMILRTSSPISAAKSPLRLPTMASQFGCKPYSQARKRMLPAVLFPVRGGQTKIRRSQPSPRAMGPSIFEASSSTCGVIWRSGRTCRMNATKLVWPGCSTSATSSSGSAHFLKRAICFVLGWSISDGELLNERRAK